MKKIFIASLTLALGVSLNACSNTTSSDQDGDHSTGSQVIAPVTVSFNELDGNTFELLTDQVLNINTGELDPTVFTGFVENQTVASFSAGKDDGSAIFNPGFIALGAGETNATLISEQDSFEATFTIVVSTQ